ncbi:MAG: histidine kinase [Proteobacteria bacterium]|nr:histidine kinase [Pseudomonadota bacterium]
MAIDATGTPPHGIDGAEPSAPEIPDNWLDARSPHGGSWLDPGLNQSERRAGSQLPRWLSWRIRLLVLVALLGALGVFAVTRELARLPDLDATWRAGPQGRIELASSADPRLQQHDGRVLEAIVGKQTTLAPDASVLQRSSRWVIDDGLRAQSEAAKERLAALLAEPRLSLHFADGIVDDVAPRPRGLGGLPTLYWILAALGLALYMLGMIVVLAQPSWNNLLYAVMACCQAVNLLFMAIEGSLELTQPQTFIRLDMPVRMALDLLTAAAMVSAACRHPRRLPGGRWIMLAAWCAVAVLLGLAQMGWLPARWWWVQGSVSMLGVLSIGLLTWSYRIEPHPAALMLRRFGSVMAGTWLLLTAALAAADAWAPAPQNVAAIGSMIWYVSLASLLLLVPFLARSQLVMREFALLAAISTIATSLDLLFVAVFAFSQFASLTLALFISLAVYAGARQWILNQLLGSSMLTTERMFEQLYRIAREVEVRPERTPALLSQLLRDLFEPMEAKVVGRESAATRVASDGSTMLVPVPVLVGDAAAGSVMLRFAQHGRRLFTTEDARLTDRIVEQLRRAVAFDRAVEQGRTEERLRLAQDLHDDIGARLLTLMYKAQSPEMEDYVRHTLQDLKTLTRGLAKSDQRLSHAAAEWKADLTQRLTAAQVALVWSFNFDDDPPLSVVYWSALTRVLRELASNAIAHAQAERLEIVLVLAKGRLDVTVIDDGHGRDPAHWSHGLGLGGVRKRVKQLGGEVEWREAAPRGIACHVKVPLPSNLAPATQPR